MKKSYIEWLESNQQISVRPSTIRGLRVIAKGASKTEAAKGEGKEYSNFSPVLKRFKKDFPILCELVEDAKNILRLVEADDPVKKAKRARQRIADAGRLPCGPAPFGTFLKDGWLYPKEEGGQHKVLLNLLEDYANGNSFVSLAKKYRFTKMSPDKIRRLVRDTRLDNRFMWGGKECIGGWERIVPEELWKRVESRYPPRSGGLIYPYEWLNQNPAIIPEKAIKCRSMIKRYINGEPTVKIIEAEEIDENLFRSLVTDERRTGLVEKDGKLLPSGYPEVINRKDFEKARSIRKSGERLKKLLDKRKKTGKRTRARIIKILSLKPNYRSEITKKIGDRSSGQIAKVILEMKKDQLLEERADGLIYLYGLPPKGIPMRKPNRARANTEIIMPCLPAFRWQIQEKLKLSPAVTSGYVQDLKRKDLVEESNDGLLQKKKLPFPEFVVEMRSRRGSINSLRILNVLPASLPEIAEKIQDISREGIVHHLRKLQKKNIVDVKYVKRPDGKKVGFWFKSKSFLEKQSEKSLNSQR